MGNLLDAVLVPLDLEALGQGPDKMLQLAEPVPSLVTKVRSNAHKTGELSGDLGHIPEKKRRRCNNVVWFRERCGHGGYKMSHKPCDRWGCEPCADWRIETELSPEIERAFTWAMQVGETLKHVVLTWRGDDLGAQPGTDGANRRRLDIQHLAQYFRRDLGRTFEYLRVAETHQKGTVHVHMLAVTPFIPQSVLSKKWADFARESFRVTVQAVGMKCPNCWPFGKLTMAEKRQRIIVPPPGDCSCKNCGYRVDRNLFDWSAAIKSVVAEMSKYLTKEAIQQGIVKRLNRSRGWAERCQSRDAETEPCDDCDSVHKYQYYGIGSAVTKWASAGVEMPLMDVAYYPDGGGACGCWRDKTEWWPSVCDAIGDVVRVGVLVQRGSLSNG